MIRHCGTLPSLRQLIGPVTAVALSLALPLTTRANDEAPLTTTKDTETLLAMRLPDIPLPDLGKLGNLRLPVPSPDDIQISFSWYLPFQTLGFKGGTMFAPFDDYSSRSAIGLVTSGRFNINPLTVFSMEMELMGTNNIFPGSNSGAETWSANTFGLYAAFRFGDPIYFKLRTGWMASTIYRNDPYEEVYSSGASMPLGLGIGWRVGPTMIMETEMTWTEDISLLTIGILL